MHTKRLRLIAACLGFTAMLAGSSFADIVIITVGEKSGTLLDRRVVPDDSGLTSIHVIKVPGL